jgi:hypothetical protein
LHGGATLIYRFFHCSAAFFKELSPQDDLPQADSPKNDPIGGPRCHARIISTMAKNWPEPHDADDDCIRDALVILQTRLLTPQGNHI